MYIKYIKYIKYTRVIYDGVETGDWTVLFIQTLSPVIQSSRRDTLE